jgi:hypothetical protein
MHFVRYEGETYTVSSVHPDGTVVTVREQPDLLLHISSVEPCEGPATVAAYDPFKKLRERDAILEAAREHAYSIVPDYYSNPQLWYESVSEYEKAHPYP